MGVFPSCLKLQSVPSHARGVNIKIVNTGSKNQGVSHLVVMSSAHPNRSSEGVLLTFPFKNWHVESLPAKPASFRSGSLEICSVNYTHTIPHLPTFHPFLICPALTAIPLVFSPPTQFPLTCLGLPLHACQCQRPQG